MSATAFDTLSTARALEASGMDRQQAEAVAAAIRAGQGDLATTVDLQAATAELRADLHRALAIQTLAVVGAVVALIKLLP
ncbi:MAG: hypothetical protein OXF33_10995 [Rhodospirillales bacterium]|nr:hypothetical protein [Rhodospirillales bacterium]